MATLIFDFDGTIANSLPVIMDIFRGLTHTPPLSEAEIKRLRQLPLHDMTRELHIAKWRVPLLLWRGRKKMRERIDEVGIFDGIDEVIGQLHGQGHQLLVMSSNETDSIQEFLRRHKLDKYFMQVYGGVGLFAKARSLQKIIHNKQINRENCYYIGDEVRDIEAALRVGIKQVAVTWGYNSSDVLRVYYPSFLLSKPQEILKIIK